MVVHVHGRNIPLTDSLLRTIEERFAGALGRREARVREVRVVVEDVNGPRGGTDMHCRAEIALAPRGRLVVDAHDGDLHRAVQAAAKRARTSVFRVVDRRRSGRHGRAA
ncbi:MAG: HPF/RaiA family ribosome-associated protein [Phycisphaerales bacterium]|nr:HPF/RaiA family ribosome-associated protein [Phycisphaerales bacterium]